MWATKVARRFNICTTTCSPEGSSPGHQDE